MKRYKGFTLVELLVVIAIMSILLTLLAPALRKAREQAQSTACMAQMRSIGIGMKYYLDESNGRAHNSPNGGLWFVKGTNVALHPDNPDNLAMQDAPYWGAAYYPYMESREVFTCPSSKRVDDFRYFADWIYYKGQTYGLNCFLANKKVDTIRPEEMIVAHDHFEHKLENDGDTFFIRPGATINLPQWRPGFGLLGDVYIAPPLSFDCLDEIFRHNRASNTLWLDGHVAPIPETTGENIPYNWYTGKEHAASIGWD